MLSGDCGGSGGGILSGSDGVSLEISRAKALVRFPGCRGVWGAARGRKVLRRLKQVEKRFARLVNKVD